MTDATAYSGLVDQALTAINGGETDRGIAVATWQLCKENLLRSFSSCSHIYQASRRSS